MPTMRPMTWDELADALKEEKQKNARLTEDLVATRKVVERITEMFWQSMSGRDWDKDWELTVTPAKGCLDDSIYEDQDFLECQQVEALRYWMQWIKKFGSV